MSVTFYAEKFLDRLEELIINQNEKPLHGAIKVYKDLQVSQSDSEKEYHVGHDISLPQPVDGYFDGINSNPEGRTAAQINFIILCIEGLVALEVIGSQNSYNNNNNQFYYRRGISEKECDDPYSQSSGYKHTLKKKTLNEFKSIYSNAVAYLEVENLGILEDIQKNDRKPPGSNKPATTNKSYLWQ